MGINPNAIILIEDDAANLEALQWLLEDEQYPTLAAPTLRDGLYLLESTTARLVISDLFGGTPKERVQNAQRIREKAFPIPVGILTAQATAREDPELGTFAFVLEKPYAIDVLLTNIAACLNIPIPDHLLPQVAIIERFFAALNAREWENALELCTDDIVYFSPHAGDLKGKALYRSYMESRTRQFPQLRLIPLQIYATPTGLAVGYRATWDAMAEEALSASVFRFVGEQICRIGNRFEKPVR